MEASEVGSRRPLAGAQVGAYMYVVDENADVWLVAAGRDLKHCALLPIGGSARSAGWLRVTAQGAVHVNCASGHYMSEDPFLPPEDTYWREAMELTIKEAGFMPGILHTGLQPLPGS